MKSILIIMLVLFVFGLTGCGTTPAILPTTPEMVILESPLYIIGGENNVEGFLDFWEGMQLIYGRVSMLGGYPLVEGVERHLEDIRKSNSILVIPPIPEGIQELRDLENKYPDLCPVSSEELEVKLESYSVPLLYFSYDAQADRVRGIILADQVSSSLATLLGTKDIPLNVFFLYENEQLQILE